MIDQHKVRPAIVVQVRERHLAALLREFRGSIRFLLPGTGGAAEEDLQAGLAEQNQIGAAIAVDIARRHRSSGNRQR